jgi:hypothetical protein
LRGKWKIISPTLLCIYKFHHYDHTALGPIITLVKCLTRLNSVPSFVCFLPLHVFSIFVGHPIKFRRYFVLPLMRSILMIIVLDQITIYILVEVAFG